MKRIYGYAVLIAGLVVAPASNVLAQTLQPIGTLVIQGVTQQPVPVFSAGVQYDQPYDIECSGGCSTAGRAEFSPFTLTKRVDAASPELFWYIANGAHHAKVTIDLFDPTVLTRYELENVVVLGTIVKSVKDGKQYALVEEVSFDYARIKQTVGSVQRCWNRIENKTC